MFASARFRGFRPRRPSLVSTPASARRRLRVSVPVLSSLSAAAAVVAVSYAYPDHLDWGLAAAVRGGRIVAASILIAADYKWSLRSAVLARLEALDKNDEDKTGSCPSESRVEALWSDVHRRSAERLAHVFMVNGGVYIKLGQHLNALVYLLVSKDLGLLMKLRFYLQPPEYTETMKVMQDKCTPTQVKDLCKMIKDETGRELEDLFSDFDENPIGVASLAQVHRAILRDSQTPVAVKLQHPQLQAHARIDTALCAWLVGVVKRIFPEFELAWLADEMSVSLPQELDFTVEASNISRVARNFSKDSVVFVPKVLWATNRVLVEEFIDGVKVDNVLELSAHKIDPLDLSEVLSRVYCQMLLWDGFLHCDLHAGNIFVRPRKRPWYVVPAVAKWFGFNPYNFDIILLDHGLYRSLSTTLRLEFCRLWTSLIRFDEPSIKESATKIFASTQQQSGSNELALEKLNSIDSSIDAHRLFSSMLTGRPWDVIASTSPEKDAATNTDDNERQDADSSSALSLGHMSGLVRLRTRDEKTVIKSKLTKRKFLSAMTKVLAILPREVLLVIKTNDILRSVDRTLGVAGAGPMFTSDGELLNEGDLGLERQKVVARRMVRRFAWMVWYCSVALRNERLKEAANLQDIFNAWIDSFGILTRVVFMEIMV
ncbi:putative aarF domain-containing protein kinase 1 [Entophlyctis sp. JEL0112]|nr:putative aarF domain-containing protein kinase 1 [Entophlyctis sp. JEL0112]